MFSRFKFLLLGLILAAIPSWPVSGQEKIHTVQKGETFYSIARIHGVKPDDLMKYNGIIDPNRLLAGQNLKIPGSENTVSIPAAVPSSGAEYINYRAVRGDSLYGIARNFSTTLEAIRRANNLSENYVLKEGDSLKIPRDSAIFIEPALIAEPVTTQPARQPPVPDPAVVLPGTGSSAAASVKAAASNLIPDTGLSWPVSAREISYMTGKLSGVVITGLRAEPVKSLTRGTVISAGPFQGFGRVAIVQVDGGYLYVYGGCESLSVKEGDRVGPGTELGKLGIDSKTNKPLLFFMVYHGNNPVDPVLAPRA